MKCTTVVEHKSFCWWDSLLNNECQFLLNIFISLLSNNNFVSYLKPYEGVSKHMRVYVKVNASIQLEDKRLVTFTIECFTHSWTTMYSFRYYYNCVRTMHFPRVCWLQYLVQKYEFTSKGVSNHPNIFTTCSQKLKWSTAKRSFSYRTCRLKRKEIPGLFMIVI